MSSVYEEDEILRKWINPYYLKPENIKRIRESSLAKPFARYCVLDNFFNEDVLDAYFEEHKNLDFEEDDKSKPYDSTVVYAEEGKHCGSELYFHTLWHALANEYIGGKIIFPDRKTVIKLRKHEPQSRGFWVHTDRNSINPVSTVVLIYLNKDWAAEDGSLLQMWLSIQPVAEGQPVDYSLEEYQGQRLNFLKEKFAFTIELGNQNRDKAYVVLIDQVVPAYNRVMFCDFIHDPAYHSVTPSNDKVRYASVQWIY